MINWIAYWTGSLLLGRGGPLQNSTDIAVPISNDVTPTGYLPTFCGKSALQALLVGIFIGSGPLVVFLLSLHLQTLGYSLRALGLPPACAR